MVFGAWLPQCLHWPFCPGVFIAILAFLAAAVTLRKEPSRLEKAIFLFIFLSLMCGEVWMMSKDRANQEKGHIQDIAALQEGFKATLVAIQSSRLDVMSLTSQIQDAKQYIAKIKSGPVVPSELKLESLELSKDILEFLHQRAVQAPPTPKTPPRKDRITTIGGNDSNINTESFSFNLETEIMLRNTYDAHLKEITRRLRKAGVLQGYVCDMLYSMDTYTSCAVEISDAARRLPN